MKRTRKRFMSLLLALVMVVGLIPAMPMTAVKANGSGDSWSDPILISTMDELFAELSKETSNEKVTYYRLTQDLSVDTYVGTTAGMADFSLSQVFALRDKGFVECKVAAGKKNLELVGHDIHYKQNVNAGGPLSYVNKSDSLTLFKLLAGADLTISNTSRDEGRIWYDGWMNDRSGWFNGPNYSYTASRDVFRVEEGAELTLNNTYVKAGRNRKIWMVNALYLDKQRTTNLIASMTWNGYAYEQIYGTAVLVNGGKVTINGGLIEGRGSARDSENVSGGNDYTGDNFDYGSSLEPSKQVAELISDSGRKAAVKIAKDGSTVIINDGEFWGNGGADVIGVYASDYKLEIHAGTFDTSKTDKERIPDHVAANHGKGPWGYLDLSYYTWYDCRAIRDTKRGDIGFGGKDGQGNDVVDLSKSRVFVEDEDHEITDVADMNEFKHKSDHDTIIIQPKEKDTFFSNTENAFGQKAFAIYATDARVKNVIGSNFAGGNETLKYDRDQGTLLWYTAESMYDLTDKDNFFLNQSVNVTCTWTLYEVTLNSDNSIKSIETTTTTATPTLTYVKDGKLLYVFRCELDNWQRTARSSYQWKQDSKVRYYMRASATESFATSKHTLTTQMDNSDEFNYGTEREYAGGLRIEYQVSFQNNLNHPEFAVEYANARYGDAPKITLSDELQTLKTQKSACFKYQWQILRNGVWEDYGNWRISPDEAALILNNHYDLLGETLRLKVTEYDNKIKGALYSKERVVTKGGSVGDDPITPAINVTEDTVHAGKYVFQIDVNSDAQEFLVVPDDGAISPSRRISFLDWSGATTSKVIDNLDYGAYVVYTRYAATATTEAGKKVAYCSAFAKTVKATEDVQISYVTRANSYTSTRNQPVLSSGDDFATYVDGGVRYFIVESVPYGANDEVNKNTQWSCSDETVLQPMKLQRSGSSFVFAECEWGSDTKGNTFAFKGIKAGIVELHAKTTLLDGTVKDTVINIHVMPDAATPYKMTTTAEGEIVKLMPGQTYEPQLVVFPDTVQPVDSKLKWVRKNSTSATPGVNVKARSGVITVSDDAQIGEIATIRGQYSLGSGLSPITFEYQVEVIASDEISAHAHPGEDHTYTTFQQYNGTQHLQICACGETAYADHEFQDKVIQQATSEKTGILRHVCKDCGYYYEETIPVGVHVHELYWDYDENEHWQNCEADECPEENYETGRGTHDFALVRTTDDGQMVYACKVCGMMKQVIPPLEITKQPESVAVEKGESASFSVEATGAGLTYLWQYKLKGSTEWVDWTSKTTATISVAYLKSRDGMTLRCVVTDKSGNSLTSDEATLTYGTPAPTLAITKQPESVVVEKGESATFSVEATGEGLTYLWQYKLAGSETWVDWTSKTTASISVAYLKSRDGMTLRCVVTDKDGNSVTSDEATLTYGIPVAALSITKHPVSINATKGESATFSVAAKGEGLTYLWQYKLKGSTDWVNWTSKKTDTIRVAYLKTRDGMKLRCVVTDRGGNSVTSDEVSLTYGTPVPVMAITKHPESVNAEKGANATFSVTATGESLTYLWQYKLAGSDTWVDWTSKTTASIGVAYLKTRDGMTLRCVVTDKGGNLLTSDEATLTYGTPVATLAITKHPESITVEKGTSAPFSVTATGESLTYLWQYKLAGSDTWVDWTSKTTASISVAYLKTRDGMTLRCVVTDGGGNSLTSDEATLTY